MLTTYLLCAKWAFRFLSFIFFKLNDFFIILERPLKIYIFFILKTLNL